MSYQRKPIGSPCAGCGAPVSEEGSAVRTLTRTLPYTPKIWHRPCFATHQAAQVAPQPNVPQRVACAR
jgi:hypothetical protein